nr:hypothetical protein [Porphyridium purpureum]UBY46130.1 hypothetical protein [Porphyridium purpureum]
MIFNNIASPNRLNIAWSQIKNNLSLNTLGFSNEITSEINEAWFAETSIKFKNDSFIYTRKRKISIFKKPNKYEARFVVIHNIKIKIIEKVLLNSLEPVFEGSWQWRRISKSEYNIVMRVGFGNDLKKNKQGFFIKNWVYPVVFHFTNHSFRPNKSCHTVMKVIKKWRNNIIWLIKYDFQTIFRSINNNRLENIFKSYINNIYIWNEIQKLIKAAILTANLLTKNSVSQNSTLSHLLFNIYFNELDWYVNDLSTNLCKNQARLNKNLNAAQKKYHNLISKFSNDKLVFELKQSDSLELLKKKLLKKKLDYYKDWSKDSGCPDNVNSLRYVRYGSEILIGIEGSKNLALNLCNKIDNFVKSNLHFTIKSNKIINRNEGAVAFLNFIVYLPIFHIKTKTSWGRLASIKKYKNKILARFAMLDAKLAKTRIFIMRKNLLRVFKDLVKNNKSPRYEKRTTAASLLINNLIDKDTKNSYWALIRWEKHFAKLFDKEQSLALKFYYKHTQTLTLPNEPKFYLKTKEVKDKFLWDLTLLLNKNKNNYFNKKIDNVLEKRDKSMRILSNYPNTVKNDIIKACKTTVKNFLDHKKTRNVNINAPISNIVENLIKKKFFHKRGKQPRANPLLIYFNDFEIITYYSCTMHGCAVIYYFKVKKTFIKFISF